ncbi:MAG: DUF6438 domain-containing protein [Bacteroidia bacterium]
MKNLLPVFIFILAFTACKPRESAHRSTSDQYEVPAVDPSTYETQSSTVATPSVPADPGTEVISDDNPPPPQITLEPLDVPDSLVASIQRTACYGTCPVYTFKIYKSGFAEYEGVHFVDSVGKFRTWVPQQRMQQLKEMVSEVNYFSFRDDYINPYIADLPSTITIIQMDGRLKRVLNGHEDTPEGLVILERFIEGIAHELGFSDKPRRED